MRRWISAVLPACAALAFTQIGPAKADTSWTLAGGKFLSTDTTVTGTLTGGFTTDGSGNIVTWDITETRTNGTSLFDSGAGSIEIFANNPPPGYGELFLSDDGVSGLRLWFTNLLTASNSPDAIASDVFTFSNNYPYGNSYDGSVSGAAVTGSTTSAPEPISLSLLATGLMGVVVARRRHS